MTARERALEAIGFLEGMGVSVWNAYDEGVAKAYDKAVKDVSEYMRATGEQTFTINQPVVTYTNGGVADPNVVKVGRTTASDFPPPPPVMADAAGDVTTL